MIPFGNDEDLGIVADSCCGMCFDNGAFSAWKSGKPIDNWQPYYDWCKEWALHPRFDFAIVPDVIDGTEDDNRQLFAQWYQRTKLPNGGWPECAPVWHLHESLDYLEFLCGKTRILCLGSSGDYKTPGTTKWHNRMADAMRVVCDSAGRPKRKLHGLRMLDPAIVERYPFASADSTNVAQNSNLLRRFGMYKPPTQSQRREVIACRIESVCSPAVWFQSELQETLFDCGGSGRR